MLKKFSPRLAIYFRLAYFCSEVCLVRKPAAAETEAVIDTGDTAWVLASTALVLFMTIPALWRFFMPGWYAKKMSCQF